MRSATRATPSSTGRPPTSTTPTRTGSPTGARRTSGCSTWQGETTMSPLQLALAYSALLNGGRIWEPTFGWGVVDAQGKVVRTITPKVRDRVPVSQKLFDYVTKSLDFSRGWAVSGAFAYMDT